MFETNSIPQAWIEIAESYDQIWVPSTFNVETYARAGVPRSKLKIVPCPLPVWAEILVDNLRTETQLLRSEFVFLSVMRWHLRKGWDILLRAFFEEFSDDPEIMLVIKARPFDPTRPEQPKLEFEQFFRDRGVAPPANIHLDTTEYSRADLARLYGSAKAFVLPSRGEGWGRPFIEALLSGLAVIGPRWGGNLEFMNDQNSILVDGVVAPIGDRAVEEWPYFADQQWFEMSIPALRRSMRSVVESSWADMDQRMAVARKLLECYSSNSIATTILSHLSGLR